MMVVYNHQRQRWEVRNLANGDGVVARRRRQAAACEVIELIERGMPFIAFPEPYDWALDGV